LVSHFIGKKENCNRLYSPNFNSLHWYDVNTKLNGHSRVNLVLEGHINTHMNVIMPLAFTLVFCWLVFRPCRWRRYVPPKRPLTFNGLHGVISQKVVLFNIFHRYQFLLRLEVRRILAIIRTYRYVHTIQRCS
jgi:hypothetical protein